MKEEKHQETIKEVLDEIESALKDKRGLVSHQRRLAFVISLGASNILELYFHKNNVIKEGSIVNHLWFKRKKEKIINQLQNQLTSPIDSLNEINKILLSIENDSVLWDNIQESIQSAIINVSGINGKKRI